MFKNPNTKRRFALETFKTPSKKKKPSSFGRIEHKRQKVVQFILGTLLFTYLLSFDALHTSQGLVSSSKISFLVLGNLFFCLILNLILSYIILVHQRQIGQKPIHLGLIYFSLFIIIVTTKITSIYHFSPFFIPLGLMVYTLALVFGQQFALIISPFLFIYIGHGLYSSILTSTAASNGNLFSWGALSLRGSFVLLLGSLVMIALCNQVNRRNKLTIAGLGLAISHLLFLGAFFLLSSVNEQNSLDGKKVLEELFFGAASGLMTGFVLSSFLPFLESFFDFTTDISLLELSSGNNPLLEKMLLEAPGTFHHSMMVGILAEAAADSIGARSLLAKVGAYYHDIGKLVRPQYFTENENYQGSKHENLSPMVSTIVILSHVKDGVELARLFNLPSAVVEIITQHHGCGLVQYFYVEALNDPNYREDFPENREKENKEFFRYSGPRAQTKEAAIVLIADSVEAASRSLSDPSPANLELLVDKIIHSKLMDQQLEDCNLTFKELNTIKASILKMLISLFHTRVKYPEANKAKH